MSTPSAGFKLSSLTVALLLAYPTFAQTTADTTTTSDEVAEVTLERMDVVVDQKDRYEKGKNEQFNNNIVTIYKDKDEVERFKGVNPADLLSGVAGVHSSDARNNGAISPNIRGLQGEGRVPVVIDGTRSEYTVYRGYAGVNNRTYVDPNLISEVRAYKGATELGHDMPLAVGGAVVMNTIDAKDVITGDKNWGVSVKYETNNNSTAPRYPDIKYGERFDQGDNFWALFGDANPQLYTPLKNSGKNKFFDDYAFRLAVAGKTDIADMMVAYSKREQGNYFSGGRHADTYRTKFGQGDDSLINFAEIMPPGYEVPNTASKNESWLIKNNWYLPKGQEINLSWRRSDLEYGEVMNTRSAYSEIIKNLFDYGPDTNIGVQWTPAKVKQDAGRIDYKFNPDDNRWLNLKTSAWYSKTDSQNNSSGAPIATLRGFDGEYDYHFSTALIKSGCIKTTNNVSSTYETNIFDLSCTINQDLLDEARQQYKDWTGNDLNLYQAQIINPALHIVRNKQYGFDLSNTFALRDNLDLTLGYNLHRQKQTASMEQRPTYCAAGYNPDGSCPYGTIDYSSYIFPPKAGNRDEHSFWGHLNWQASDKLNIQVGGRWGRASLEDTYLEEKVAKGEWKRPVVRDFMWYSVQYTPTKEEYENLFDFSELANKKGVWDIEDIHERNMVIDEIDAFIEKNIEDYKAKYGYDGTYIANMHKYIFYRGNYKWYADKNGRFPAETAPYNQTHLIKHEGEYFSSGVGDNLWADGYKPADIGKRKYKGEFDPSVSVSYAFTPHSRVYARYNQVTRFPSMYEGLSGFSQNPYSVDPNGWGELVIDYLEPEVAKNLEVGYVQDLTRWLPNWKSADIKLNYYHNRLTNVIDRSDSALSNFFTQYERLNTKGIELQGRMDAGKVFGDISYSYLMESEMCDSRAQILLNKIYNYDPNQRTCYTGGFPNGYLRGAIPPKHSISLSMGSRFLDDRLVLGGRISYQSNANAKKSAEECKGSIACWGDQLNRGTNSYVWKSYYTLDAYADYMPMPNLKLSLIGTNLTNEYHPDALTRTAFPAPGRTFKLAMEYKF